jgi:hypothetical protein
LFEVALSKKKSFKIHYCEGLFEVALSKKNRLRFIIVNACSKLL